MQFSEVFSVSEHTSFLADKKLKCWMQASCTKAFVSLVVARAEHAANLEKVRVHLMKQPLRDGFSVLAQKKKIQEIGELQVQLYQQVVDFDGALAFETKNADGSSAFKTLGHSCTVQSGELSVLSLDYSD